MKSEINKLSKVRNKIIERAEKRDALALKRSDDWYDSPKGKKHEASTGKLADVAEKLSEAINELKTYTTEL
ncbi:MULTISPECIES: hypothetical protein [Bizionia]|uniref:Uncharacterized protein n=1 Tax=Bizionia algoritergicola TaxID=291187 RepID=A0A5D0QLI9_9FLAO|nr:MULTISPECIES: hypothetical protein [Bizionia]OBX17469.1 hypothetical protein BAA08_16355 [Bizionia sp. APA-3]OBX17471.1 hypothetical protein BAA08_16340 [Bizionia sp. APA-3]TYB69044.1 hypothetical protein ES675_16320 [Bizionia algoritergicola]